MRSLEAGGKKTQKPQAGNEQLRTQSPNRNSEDAMIIAIANNL